MKKVLFFLLFPCTMVFGQPAVYTTANAHSHNDYQQAAPFYSAYNLQYGSIEADVYLSISNGELLVAHTAKDTVLRRTLEDLYLKPLSEYITTNKGNVYADTSRKLVFMLDVKTGAVSTINKVIDVLMKYPNIRNCPSLTILVSGNKPDPTTYIDYPAFLWFDGLLSAHYTKETLNRVVVLSDNFINYTSWNGVGDIPANDLEKLKKAVARGHALGKKVRFWNTPDFIEGWKKIMELGVDYLDSDSIKALAQFLKESGGKVQ